MSRRHYVRGLMILVCVTLTALTTTGRDVRLRTKHPSLTISSVGKNVREVPERSSIIPGRRVGELKLGDSTEEFREILGWKANVDEDYSYPAGAGCLAGLEELHWLDADNSPVRTGTGIHAGVFAYLRNGHIFQISVASPIFQTANGITEDSSPEKVKHFYPNLKAYWRVNQRNLATGDRDFIYWVDENKGIAFEFYYARDVRKRLVYRIYVFKPGTNFLPEGCVQYPQSWRKIAPYSLEPPIERSH